MAANSSLNGSFWKWIATILMTALLSIGGAYLTVARNLATKEDIEKQSPYSPGHRPLWESMQQSQDAIKGLTQQREELAKQIQAMQIQQAGMNAKLDQILEQIKSQKERGNNP